MIETRTYRAPSLRGAMRLAHKDMGTSALVIHSGPVHVPHQNRAVAFDVVATGNPTLPANEATTGVGTLPLDPRIRTRVRSLFQHATRKSTPIPIKLGKKTAKVTRLHPQSTPTTRLTDRLEDLRDRFDSFVRTQQESPSPQKPSHLRLVQEARPLQTNPIAPWKRTQPTSVAIVGPRNADKSFVALEMACAGAATGRDTVLVHITGDRDPAVEALLTRARRKGVEAHAMHSTHDLQTLQQLLGEVDLMIVDVPPHNPFSAEAIESVVEWGLAGLEPLLVIPPQMSLSDLQRVVAHHSERGITGITTARRSLVATDSPLSQAAENAGIPVFLVPPAEAARQTLPSATQWIRK